MSDRLDKKIKERYTKYVLPSIKEARYRKNSETKYYDYQISEEARTIGQGKKYLLKTYGCQGNLADSEKLAGILEAMGYTVTDNDELADIIIFNTCAIRENAEMRVFGELGRIKGLKKKNPHLILGICGCMTQEEVTTETLRKKFPHVDLIFGTHNIAMLAEYIVDIAKTNYEKGVVEVFSVEGDIYEGLPQVRDHKYRAWVNIMYGCDEFCTYCIVPYTRGKERSRHKDDIISDDVLIERRESKSIEFEDIEAVESILDFLNYKKVLDIDVLDLELLH